DFVDVKELGVDAGHFLRRALVVVIDELDLAPEQAAFLVDLVAPDLDAEQALLADRREEAGERHGEADLERRLVLGVGRREAEHRRRGERSTGRPQYGSEIHFTPPF